MRPGEKKENDPEGYGEWLSSHDDCQHNHIGSAAKMEVDSVKHFAPKHLHSGLKTTELANFFTVGIFNDGMKSILQMFTTMDVIVGSCAWEHAKRRDMRRTELAEKRHQETMKEARTARRKAAAEQQLFYEKEQGELYGPGIAE